MDIQKDEDFEKAWQENRHIWESTKNLAKAMFYAGQAKAQAVPEGFVVVPKEPTDEMWSSGIDAYTDAMESNKTMPAISIIDIYKAMLSASQESK